MSFNVEELALMVYITPDRFARWKKFQEVCGEDPVLKNDVADYSKSRAELIELYTRKVARIHRLFGYDEETAELAVIVFPEQMPTILSIKMFIPTIRNLGSDKQIEKWIPLASTFQIIGCYAQTELGHGSDVQSLETTATYDHKTEEFVINSPTITSTKWWIGDLGVFATHCVTQANLLIDGKNFGIQTFIVPIRDTKTYEPLPGITVGEIGPKHGYNVKDNGFMRFNNIRIPRENMLMRYAKVSKSGEFTKALNEKIGYATMLQVRTAILRQSFGFISCGVSIAAKYAHTRKQFKNTKGEEQPIIEYQVQQDKIIPLIADTYAILFGTQKVTALTQENIKRITEKSDYSLLNDLHALVSCCKAIYTWTAYFGLEKLRQSCGGHGYHTFSRFPSLIQDFSPTCTYEGENTVLLLQCARYLVKTLAKAYKGQAVNENVEYLVNIQTTLQTKFKIERAAQLMCPDYVRKLLRANAAYHVQQAGSKLMSGVSEKGLSQKDSWDKYAGIALVEASVAHNHYWTLKTFIDQIFKASDENLRAVLGRLCALYGVQRILEKPQGYIEAGFFQGEDLERFFEAKEILLEELKPDMLALTNAFYYSDNSFNSALTKEDPYSTLLDWSKNKNPVNDPAFVQKMYQKNKVVEGRPAAKL